MDRDTTDMFPINGRRGQSVGTVGQLSVGHSCVLTSGSSGSIMGAS